MLQRFLLIKDRKLRMIPYKGNNNCKDWYWSKNNKLENQKKGIINQILWRDQI